MDQSNLLSLLNKENTDISAIFKEVYNLFFDKRTPSWEEEKISTSDFLRIKELVRKKENGEDITFDIGYRYFRGHKISLIKGVFVPQFDTEQIIDLVISNKIHSGRALEIGSGTGAISIALKSETNLEVDSLDINSLATNLSNKNKGNLDINYINKDFFDFKVTEKYDLLISNPPYIEKGDQNIEEWVKENQPEESLYANKQGLSFYIAFFGRARELLNNGGYIIIEIGFGQAKAVCELANKISKNVEVIKDYDGFDRFVVVKYEY